MMKGAGIVHFGNFDDVVVLTIMDDPIALGDGNVGIEEENIVIYILTDRANAAA